MKSSNKLASYRFPTEQEIREQYEHSPPTPNPKMYGKSDKVPSEFSSFVTNQNTKDQYVVSANKTTASPVSVADFSFFDALYGTGLGVFKSISSAAVDQLASYLAVTPTQSESE